MRDFYIFLEESVFEVDENSFEIFCGYIGVLVKHPHPFQSSRPKSLDKLYFFQDVWFLIQLGTQYKQSITRREVTLKKVRIAFLDYLVTLEELKIAGALPEQERFIFCYRYLEELFDYCMKWGKERAIFSEVQSEYYGAIRNLESTKDLQQKIIERYYSDWLKQGYLLTKLFQDKLLEVETIRVTMQDVCGLLLGDPELDVKHFIQAIIKADDLLEIAFWKKKFKEQGVNTVFEQTNQPFSTIVVCMQQSDMMRPVFNMQMGLVCTILAVGREEERDCVYIPYAERIGEEIYCERGHVTIEQYIQIVRRFLGGDGEPSYCQLLNAAFIMLKLSTTSSGGDIILICDDTIHTQVPQDEMWKRAVERYKREKNIRIIVLYRGTYHAEMSIWFADRVIFIEDFRLEIGAM